MMNPWDNIETPEIDLMTIRANAKHPLDFFWAKDHLNNYLFVYEYPVTSEIILNDIPDLRGIETSSSVYNDVARLIFSLREKDNWEIFHHLCINLIDSTNSLKDTKKAPTYILNRLRSWHRFLQKNRLGILREEEIKGLIGELLFLKNHVIPKYHNEAINFWIGPQGMPQDFAVNKTAIEVKSQFGGSRPRVKISSEDQLFTQLERLVLYVVTLGKTTADSKNAINLPSLIKEIEELLLESPESDINKYQDALFQSGYSFSEKYYEYNYLFSDEQAFEVRDEFPRIVPNDLKEGVSQLSYSIHLSECNEYKISVEDWE